MSTVVIIDGQQPGPELDALLAEVGEPTMTITISGAAGTGKSAVAGMVRHSIIKNLFNTGRFKDPARIKIVVEQVPQ